MKIHIIAHNQMYDQIRDLPLLIKQKIYSYLPYTKYESMYYVLISLQKPLYGGIPDSNHLQGLFYGRLLNSEEYQLLTYFDEYDYGSVYIKIEKTFTEPKEIDMMVKTLGQEYSSHSSKNQIFNMILDNITRTIEFSNYQKKAEASANAEYEMCKKFTTIK